MHLCNLLKKTKALKLFLRNLEFSQLTFHAQICRDGFLSEKPSSSRQGILESQFEAFPFLHFLDNAHTLTDCLSSLTFKDVPRSVLEKATIFYSDVFEALLSSFKSFHLWEVGLVVIKTQGDLSLMKSLHT